MNYIPRPRTPAEHREELINRRMDDIATDDAEFLDTFWDLIEDEAARSAIRALLCATGRHSGRDAAILAAGNILAQRLLQIAEETAVSQVDKQL